jgi:hypothetical protein
MLTYIAVIAVWALAIAMMGMFALGLASLSPESRTALYLYFALATAFVVWPLHGFLAWWALVTITPLVIEAVAISQEVWCAYCDHRDDPAEPDAEKPKKTSRRFLDWQHAWDHLGCHYPGLKACDAEQVKKLAMLMFFGWSLVEVVETDHSFRVLIQRGAESKKLIIVKAGTKVSLVHEVDTASSPV